MRVNLIKSLTVVFSFFVLQILFCVAYDVFFPNRVLPRIELCFLVYLFDYVKHKRFFYLYGILSDLISFYPLGFTPIIFLLSHYFIVRVKNSIYLVEEYNRVFYRIFYMFSMITYVVMIYVMCVLLFFRVVNLEVFVQEYVLTIFAFLCLELLTLKSKSTYF